MSTTKKYSKHICGHIGRPIINSISGQMICPVCGMYISKGKGRQTSLQITEKF